MDIVVLRLAVFGGGFSLMFIIESIFPQRQWNDRRIRRLLFHLGLMILGTVLLHVSVIGPLFSLRAEVFSRGWGLSRMLGLHGAGEILFCLVMLDMFDYWWHRFNHRVPFLWRFHKVHHVDTHVDVTTSLRFHPGEFFISVGVKSLWIVLIGPSLWGFIVFETMISLASQFHHSNIDFPDSVENPLRKVFVTPRFHASHHTVCRRTGDENFSTIFIFWDKFFGSYRQPDYQEMEMLGLEGGRNSYLSIGATLKGPFAKEY